MHAPQPPEVHSEVAPARDFPAGRPALEPRSLRRPNQSLDAMHRPARKHPSGAPEPVRDSGPAALTEHVIEWGGRPVGSLKTAWGAAVRRAALPGVTPHTMRHTAGVWMAEAGVPMPEIARLLGHSDSRITEKVYARHSPTHLAGAASHLEIDLTKRVG